MSASQLMGRFGRRFGSLPSDNVVDIICSLDGYMSMLRRICFSLSKMNSTKANKRDTESLAKCDLLRVLRMLVLRDGCFQARLANISSKPGSFKFDPHLMKCNACHVCMQNWDSMFLPVHYQSLCLMLANESVSSTIQKDVIVVIDSLWKKKDMIKVLFPKFPSKICKHHISSMFLQLVATGVIILTYSAGDKKYPFCLVTDLDGIPLYSKVGNFEGMTLV